MENEEKAWKPGKTGAPRPPLVKGLPLFGNFFDMAQDIFPLLVRASRDYGPVFRIKAFSSEWVCLVGAEANALITHTAYEYLAMGEAYQGFNDTFKSNSFLVGIDGPRHAHLRRVERRAFSREALARKLPEAVALTDAHIARWRDGDVIDIVQELKALVVAHLSLTLTGRDASALLGDVQTLLNHIVAVTQLKIWPKFLLSMPHFTGARERVYADIRRLLREHRERPQTGEEADLIDDMLAASGLDGGPLPDDAIIAATMGAYMAGLDTAAIIATFILYGILRHRAVYDRVMVEIDDAFAQGPLTWERIASMTAFRGAAMEALRLFPVVGLLPRDAVIDFEFMGHQIHRGEQLFLGITATHFDERYFPDPLAFDIERYSPPRNEHKKGNVYAPFGLGAHKCLGGNMGELQAMVVAATMLHRLQLRLSPLDYDMKVVAKPLRRPELSFRLRVLGRRTPGSPARSSEARAGGP